MPSLFELLRKEDPDERERSCQSDTFEEVLTRRLARRSFLKSAASGLPFLAAGAQAAERRPVSRAIAAPAQRQLQFPTLPLVSAEAQAAGAPGDASALEDYVRVPRTYSSQVLLRWGDPLTAKAAAFDPLAQAPASQAQQFGYNCDFLAFFPFQSPFSPINGLLTVNHEYTNEELMFPNYDPEAPTADQVNIGIAAHGVSIVHLQDPFYRGGPWAYLRNSKYNRRITGETEMDITGPAAGDAWMKTSYDPTGTKVRGTFNNCGGGKTPWGTLLTAEENFDQYFANRNSLPDGPLKTLHGRFGVPTGASGRKWELYHPRFDVAQEPNEPNRFGWIVEIDPFDPASKPRKRTALGRTKHEAAVTTTSTDGRAVVYSGDDARFEYVYKFVSTGKVDKNNRAANFGLLDSGTLYVATFNDDGTGEWLPLIHGQGPLTPLNGYTSQGDVLIKTRLAADALVATPMDRPEDIEVSPATKKVYVALTNNTARTAAQVDAPNPRANNRAGHIIEITEASNDNGATTFTWEIFILCGNPGDPAAGTYFAGFDQSKVSALAAPDNLLFDASGNLWIATDGQPGVVGGNDGIYAVPTEGAERGNLRQFLSGVRGCEVAALEFNAFNNALFASIQHPGEGGTWEEPRSLWPDSKVPSRPSVVVVSRLYGGGTTFPIGT